jgi:hypothetical protein
LVSDIVISPTFVIERRAINNNYYNVDTLRVEQVNAKVKNRKKMKQVKERTKAKVRIETKDMSTILSVGVEI